MSLKSDQLELGFSIDLGILSVTAYFAEKETITRYFKDFKDFNLYSKLSKV